MKTIRWKIVLFILIASLLLTACSADLTFETPPETGDGWQTAALQDANIDSKPLSDLVKRIQKDKYKNIHGIVIVRDGKLVFEQYFPGYTYDYAGEQNRGEFVEFDKETLHNQASVTKAFTSAIVGIAVDQGHIEGVETKMFDFFPEYDHLREDWKNEVTLEHLLTMTSGMDWNEMDIFYSEIENDIVQLWVVDDPVEYILSKDILLKPGTHWYYNGGETNLLGEIVRRTTGMGIDEFGTEHLFKPLNISAYEWQNINPTFVYTSGDMKLCPRDMAKLGFLLINEGQWQDTQVLSQEWVQATTQAYAEVTPESWRESEGATYGYQWWNKDFEWNGQTVTAYHRSGWGGQHIFAFPTLDTVIVLTGGNYTTPDPTNEIVQEYLLQALK